MKIKLTWNHLMKNPLGTLFNHLDHAVYTLRRPLANQCISLFINLKPQTGKSKPVKFGFAELCNCASLCWKGVAGSL
ncbi:unnamed protein product [Coffea canephora]|uniref:Uncharacterized protein n=1 Tax=Coffea canephora TaxID=49390 RepID=A0A068UCV4_COFCA|nr:unnamed protein product [Coffea canephora]